MDEQQRDAIVSFWFLCGFVAICWASVRGCQTVYDPASLKADAEARISLSKAFPYAPPSSVPK